MYGKFINDGILVSTKQKDGYKPVVETEEPEVAEGYRNYFEYVENGDVILQVWHTEPYIPLEPPIPTPEEELQDAKEALNILGVT